MGIDYGTKRLGIALSDGDGKLAFPLLMIENREKTVEEIHRLCKENKIEIVVVGESINFKGQENPVMEEIKSFVLTLEKETHLPVRLEPEFLTSAQASRVQGEHGKLDASAAALILQSYLDKKTNGLN